MTLDGIMQKELKKEQQVKFQGESHAAIVRQWGGSKRINLDPNFDSTI